MIYLVVDAMVNGTGIRDYYEGGYILLKDLALPSDLSNRINLWLKKYEVQFHEGYINQSLVEELDTEGIEIAKQVQESLHESKVNYYSDATSLTTYLSVLQ